VAGALALAWIFARLSRPQVAYRRTLLLVLGALPIAMIGSSANSLTEDRWVYVVIAGVGVIALSYFKRGLRAITGTNQFRALLVGAAATFGFVALTDALYVNPSLWQYSDEDADEETDDSGTADRDAWARMQELQFGQQARIDTEIAAIRAARERSPQGSTPQLYFLGFAGVGEQRVFAGEIALAAQRVGERYKSTQRSLSLVNDRRDPEKLPLATVPALRHALRELVDHGARRCAVSRCRRWSQTHHQREGHGAGRTRRRNPGADAAGVAHPLKVIIPPVTLQRLHRHCAAMTPSCSQPRQDHPLAVRFDLTTSARRLAMHCRGQRACAAFAPRAPPSKREKQEHFDASDPQAYFGTAMGQATTLEGAGPGNR
jgi:hypothetical protein